MNEDFAGEQNWVRRNFWLVALLGYFAISLAVVSFWDLNTLAGALDDHWQYLDLGLLRQKPYESLLYLNSQPPLLNLIAWGLDRLPGSLYGNFVVLNAACIALVCLLLFGFLRRFVGPLVALTLSLLYLLSPGVLLNIGYPFYPCLTTLGYAVLLHAMFMPVARRRQSLLLLVVAIAYLSLLRSSFSILHAVFFSALYFLVNFRGLRFRDGAVAACAVLLFASAVPAKNYLLYGFFSASSWTPVNIAKGVGAELPIGYFPTPAEIRAGYPGITCEKVYGVQDSSDVKGNGLPNFNSCFYVEYAKIVKKQVSALYDFRAHAKRVQYHVLRYFSVPDKYLLLKNRAPIAAYADAVNHIEFLSVDLRGKYDIRFSLLLVVALATYACWKTRSAFLGVCLTLFVVHFASHVLTDGDEADRFVFDIEFVFFVMFAACLGYFSSILSKRSSKLKPQPTVR